VSDYSKIATSKEFYAEVDRLTLLQSDATTDAEWMKYDVQLQDLMQYEGKFFDFSAPGEEETILINPDVVVMNGGTYSYDDWVASGRLESAADMNDAQIVSESDSSISADLNTWDDHRKQTLGIAEMSHMEVDNII
jgi:hypothetical protein